MSIAAESESHDTQREQQSIERLRATMAAARVSFNWLGVRK